MTIAVAVAQCRLTTGSSNTPACPKGKCATATATGGTMLAQLQRGTMAKTELAPPGAGGEEGQSSWPVAVLQQEEKQEVADKSQTGEDEQSMLEEVDQQPMLEAGVDKPQTGEDQQSMPSAMPALLEVSAKRDEGHLPPGAVPIQGLYIDGSVLEEKIRSIMASMANNTTSKTTRTTTVGALPMMKLVVPTKLWKNGWSNKGIGHGGNFFFSSRANGGKIYQLDLLSSAKELSITSTLDLSKIDSFLQDFYASYFFIGGDFGFAAAKILRQWKVVRFSLQRVDSMDAAASLDCITADWGGGFADDAYGYLTPFSGGKIARFNIAKFDSMEILDLSGAGISPHGTYNGFFSGDYVYLPKQLVRFNRASFSNPEALDLTSSSGDSTLRGFGDGFAAGVFGYLCPRETASEGRVVRFSLETFGDIETLQQLPYGPNNGATGYYGYLSCFTDGVNGYVIPGYTGKVQVFNLETFEVTKEVDPEAVGFKTEDCKYGFSTCVKMNGGFQDGSNGYVIGLNDNALFRFPLGEMPAN